MSFINSIVTWFSKELGDSPQLQKQVIYTVLIIFVLWLINKLVFKFGLRHIKDIQIRYRSKKTVSYIIVLLGILLVGRLWFAGFQSLTTFLGLFSAGLAIALRDLVVNIAGWLFIIWRRPFIVGDRIQIGKHSGDVIDFRLFQFTLLEIGEWVEGEQSTGRIIHIPNGKIFTEALANYYKGFQYTWNEVPVLITFESNWKKAKKILQEIGDKHAEHLSTEAQKRVREASRKFLIFYSKLTPTVYTSVKDSGILLTIRYLCGPRRQRGTNQSIWEDILEKFAECEDIDFAYPTYRLYNNTVEGKSGNRDNN